MKIEINDWELEAKENLSILDKQRYYELGGHEAYDIFKGGLSADDLDFYYAVASKEPEKFTKLERSKALHIATKIDNKKKSESAIARLKISVTSVKYKGESKSLDFLLENASFEEVFEFYDKIEAFVDQKKSEPIDS